MASGTSVNYEGKGRILSRGGNRRRDGKNRGRMRKRRRKGKRLIRNCQRRKEGMVRVIK